MSKEKKKEQGEWDLCPKCERPWKFHFYKKLDLIPSLLLCPKIVDHNEQNQNNK